MIFNRRVKFTFDSQVYLWTMSVTAYSLWKERKGEDAESKTFPVLETSETKEKIIPTSPIKKVACCDDHIVSLSEDGVVYEVT